MPVNRRRSVIRQRHFDGERLDIALRAAHVALRREIVFHAFEKHFAFENVSRRQLHAHRLPELDRIDVALLHVGAHPKMVHIHQHHDGRALRDHFSLLGDAHGDDSVDRRVNFRVAKLRRHLRFGGARLLQLRDRGRNVALADVHLLAVRLRDIQRGGFRLCGFFQRVDVGLRNVDGGFGVVAVLRRNFSLVEKLLHAGQVILVARERHARLFELRVARGHVSARLIDRRAGLVVRPRIIVIGLVHLRFEARDVRFRGREVRLQFLGIEFGDQVALLHFGAFIDCEIDDSPGDLRADDHFVAVHDSGQAECCCPGASSRCKPPEQSGTTSRAPSRISARSSLPRSPGLAMQSMIQKIQQRPFARLHRPRREKIAAHDFAQDRRGGKIGGGHAQNTQSGVVGIDGAEFSRRDSFFNRPHQLIVKRPQVLRGRSRRNCGSIPSPPVAPAAGNSDASQESRNIPTRRRAVVRAAVLRSLGRGRDLP